MLYADAKAAKDAGDEKGAEKLRSEARVYTSKERYLAGFGNLETGEIGFIDLTANQGKALTAAIGKYTKKLDKVAFELSKSGNKTDTVVSLTPILDMDEDLTEAERANFDKLAGVTFDFAAFDGFLYEADEAEQTKNLVIAGFDIGRLGLTLGAGANTPQPDEAPPIEGDAPAVNF
jgi:hypothetical protein